MGVSVARLNGWEPAEVTTLEWDGDRLMRMVTVRESEFTATEKALLLTSRRDALDPRGAHGLLLSETTDPAHQYDWDVDLPTTDFAQAKLSKAQDAYSKQWPDADRSSMLWRGFREP